LQSCFPILETIMTKYFDVAGEKDRKIKSPWDFTCPEYDQRSSVFVEAGTNYGVGKKNPVGHEGNPRYKDEKIPYPAPYRMAPDGEG